jgi:putative SOS response-associated peptidase YedK
MCGRYAARRDPAVLAEEFDAADETGGRAPGADHNVAPTKPVLSVVDTEKEPEGRAVRVMRWGLVPHWAKDRGIAAKMINARAETVETKPAFRTALAKRRCLLPADGWYEWRRADGRKQPYFMTPADGGGLAMAGIWSVWHDPTAGEDAPPLVTCAVITTQAVGPLTDIHDRMPLVLPRRAWADWLDPASTGFGSWLAPVGEDVVGSLELRPVSDRVNSVRNNGPELCQRVAEPGAAPPGLDAAPQQPTLFGPSP